MVFSVTSARTAEEAIADPCWDSEMARAIQAYVANPLFRSATFDELVIDDNPYRRPVRPEDLDWLKFDRPLSRKDSSQLSSLLGHRMLLNIYDVRLPLLPLQMSSARRDDFELFYASQHRARGERIRPFLEHHLFAYVRDAERPASLYGALQRLAEDRTSAAARLMDTVSGATDRTRATTMAALQVVATALAPAGEGVRGKSLAGTTLERRVSQLAAALDLREERHSYYQFYLPSTLALMNYLGATGNDPRDTCVLAGAITAYRVDLRARLEALEHAARDLGVIHGEPAKPDGDEAQWPERAVSLTWRYGPKGSAEFIRGLEEFTELLAVNDDDLQAQLRLVDGAKSLQHKAQRLYWAINEYHIPVDLDTFVESWEECSTTHVHDDDRLVVVESGEMEFWACLGQRIKLGPGDMFFVPKHRLHGSVVQSGTCVYHQPVITAELEAQYR